MSWIKNIGDTILNALKNTRTPAMPIPGVFLVCESATRPGLSAISLSTSVISRMHEIGVPTGPNPDGSPNLINEMIRIFSEETIKEINEKGVVNVSMKPGDIKVIVNPSGEGENVTMPVLQGIVR